MKFCPPAILKRGGGLSISGSPGAPAPQPRSAGFGGEGPSFRIDSSQACAYNPLTSILDVSAHVREVNNEKVSTFMKAFREEVPDVA